MAEQLRMFMTPHEIMQEYHPNPGDFEIEDDTEGDLWDRKAMEAADSGLEASIRKHGIKMPISLDPKNRIVRGGHHRLAVAHYLSPHQFIPVMHVDSVDSAGQAEYDIEMNANDKDVTGSWGY